jgi:AraC-like DNA-binding protein/mannose-6-phosphate isomerase-like protein (cupin superfamily)
MPMISIARSALMPQTVYFPTKPFHIERAVSKRPMSFMHHHDSYEIYYTISGEREYFIENSFFKASVGDFVLIPKNMLHRTAGKGADRILIYFEETFLKQYFSKEMISYLLSDFRPKIFRPNQETQEKSRALIYTLLSAYKAQAEPTLLASYLFQLLLWMNTEENKTEKAESSDQRINQILCYINENYQNLDTIEEIANHFYISKYHLCRSFSKNMGISLVTYLNTVKVRAACNMLQKGTQSMTEIAFQCGFHSSAYFCKVFKQETGCSPREYKTLHKNPSHQK